MASLVKDPRVACRVIDGQSFIVSPWDHKLHKLDVVGTFIWDLVEKKRSRTEIVTCVAGSFDVSIEEARKDTAVFLAELVRNGLLTETNG